MPTRLVCVNEEFQHYFIEDYNEVDDNFQPKLNPRPKRRFYYILKKYWLYFKNERHTLQRRQS